jgi:hypothetical protein
MNTKPFGDVDTLTMIQIAICPSHECDLHDLPHTPEEYDDCKWLAMEMLNSSNHEDHSVSDWDTDRNWADSRWPNEY